MKDINSNISQFISIYQKLDEFSQNIVIGHCLACYELQRKQEYDSDIDMLIATYRDLNSDFKSSVLECCRKNYIEMQCNTKASKQSGNIILSPKRKSK